MNADATDEALDAHRRALRAMGRIFRRALPATGTRVDDVLSTRVRLLRQAHEENHAGAAALLRVHLGESDAEHLPPSLARAVIAREHGYRDWAATRADRDQFVDPRFETAADAIPAGGIRALKACLDAYPALAQARSPFGHHATLLHYIAANGVESTRQWQTPPNAVEITRLLLERGAEPDALCETYGGGSAQTPLCLLASSEHPAAAGVQGQLVEELCRGGADPDGVGRDGLPLWTAVIWGYPAAAEALVRSGATVDGPVLAAALGDLARVKAYLDGADHLESALPPPSLASAGTTLHSGRWLELALIYAAGHGREEVVKFLLGKEPDLTVTEPFFETTALGAARYRGHDHIATMIERARGDAAYRR